MTDKVSDISEFAVVDGKRNRSFSVGRVTVLVSPPDRESDSDAAELVENLANFAAGREARRLVLSKRLEESTATVNRLTAELENAKGRIPPEKPARLTGTGCIRFDSSGRLWLMGSQSKGWAAFGLYFRSWHELFAEFDARVTSHGIDEHGPFWLCASGAKP